MGECSTQAFHVLTQLTDHQIACTDQPRLTGRIDCQIRTRIPVAAPGRGWADGLVKVLDFGLAQDIREGTGAGTLSHLPAGTVRYMSPEQKRAGKVTGASDVYALGVVLEELGRWRHPLLTRMRSSVAEHRPDAAKVASELERLDRSHHYAALVAGLILLALIARYAFIGIGTLINCTNLASTRSPGMRPVMT